MCGPYHLYDEQASVSAPSAASDSARCGAAATASIEIRAPAACAAATIASSSGTVPVAFDAAVTATQRVRSDSTASIARRGQRERVAVRLGPAHGRARALGRDHPRPDVGVVVEPGDDDLVARAERAPERGREPHRHRRHRRPEGDAARLGAEQPGDRVARGLDAGVGRVRGGEHAAVVRVVARAHERGHGVDRAVDHLGARGAVEPRPAAGEAGEAVAVHSRAPAARTSSASCG